MMAQQEAPPPSADQQQGPPQGPPPNGGMKMNPEHRVEMMQRRLNLSESQTAQVKAIFAEGQTKMEALRANSSLAPQDRHAQMEEMRKGMLARINGVLTPEQQAKFEEMQAKMREKQRERQQASQNDTGAPPPPPPAAPQL